MDRNVIHKIGKKQMEGEKGRSQEEVVHRVKIDVAHGGDDEHQEEKEEQRDWGEEADFTSQRSRL